MARAVIAEQGCRAETTDSTGRRPVLVPVPDAPPTLDDYLYIFYERAAIGEYDGGLSRTAAERQALGEVLTMFAAQGFRTAGDTANGCQAMIFLPGAGAHSNMGPGA